MVASGVVSIPSAIGHSTLLTIDGQDALRIARAFQDTLLRDLSAGTLAISQGIPEENGSIGFAPAVASQFNEAVVSADEDGGAGIGGSATIPVDYGFVFDNVNGATTVNGPADGINGIFAGIGAAATFVDGGGKNAIEFVDGNNLYVGDASATAGSDTIAAGTGTDTIDTGWGDTTVYGGTGAGQVSLNDTAPGVIGNNTYNDFAFLSGGQDTVNAEGRSDAIIVSAPGQVIYGGNAASDYTVAVLTPETSAPGVGGNVVYGGAGTTAAFVQSGGNTIFGGSGKLLFIGGVDAAATVASGSGENYLFGAASESITWTTPNAPQSTANVFVAGAGSESVDGSGATTGLAFFGFTDPSAAAASGVADVFRAGAGNDTLVSGLGAETMYGGVGDNVFLIAAQHGGAPGNVMIEDFGASGGNILGFTGFTTGQVDAALAATHAVTGPDGQAGVAFTLSDNTTVTVFGVTNLSGHTITFGG